MTGPPSAARLRERGCGEHNGDCGLDRRGGDPAGGPRHHDHGARHRGAARRGRRPHPRRRLAARSLQVRRAKYLTSLNETSERSDWN